MGLVREAEYLKTNESKFYKNSKIENTMYLFSYPNSPTIVLNKTMSVFERVHHTRSSTHPFFCHIFVLMSFSLMNLSAL